MTLAYDIRTGELVGQAAMPTWGVEPVGLVRLLAPRHPNANAQGIVYVIATSVRLEKAT